MEKVNFYFAVLLITIAGAGASLLIIRVAYNNAFAATFVSTKGPTIPPHHPLNIKNKRAQD